LGNKFGKEKKKEEIFFFFYNEVFLSCVALAHSITLGEGKKHIKSKKVNFLFLFFVFQVSKLNWRYKIKKERKRWAEKKNYTQIFDTTRWRTSQ
jgi:hypothetical protein